MSWPVKLCVSFTFIPGQARTIGARACQYMQGEAARESLGITTVSGNYDLKE